MVFIVRPLLYLVQKEIVTERISTFWITKYGKGYTYFQNLRGFYIMHSFLLIGQSNMAGRGYLNEAHEIDTSRIYILRNGRWQTMFRPINPDRSFSGVNLAESFAEGYAKKHNVDVGLICCADGGTRLDQWKPGELLFDNAVQQAKLACRTSKIAGVRWHQGESDCSKECYPTYQQRLEIIISALRKELGLYDVPFILGGLGDYLQFCPLGESMKNYVHINNALKNIAASNAMTGFASAEGLTSNPDNLHFDAASLYEFGLRYLKAFESLQINRNSFHDIRTTSDIQRSEMELL